MVQKPTFKTVKLTIPVGSKEAIQKIDIPKGVAVFLGAQARPAQDQIVDCAVYENGQRILDPIDVAWLDGNNGSFRNRTLELPYNGGSTIEVEVKTQNNVAGSDLNIEFVFGIWQQHPRIDSAWDQSNPPQVLPGC